MPKLSIGESFQLPSKFRRRNFSNVQSVKRQTLEKNNQVFANDSLQDNLGCIDSNGTSDVLSKFEIQIFFINYNKKIY